MQKKKRDEKKIELIEREKCLKQSTRPIPYWLAFSTLVDGRGSVKVIFKIDTGSPDLGKAALALLQRNLFADAGEELEHFSFSPDGDLIGCEAQMSGFDFTIFDVAEKKQQAEEFFSKVVNEAERIKTVMDYFKK